MSQIGEEERTVNLPEEEPAWPRPVERPVEEPQPSVPDKERERELVPA